MMLPGGMIAQHDYLGEALPDNMMLPRIMLPEDECSP